MHFSSSRVVRKTSKRDFIVVINVCSTAQTSEIVSFFLRSILLYHPIHSLEKIKQFNSFLMFRLYFYFLRPKYPNNKQNAFSLSLKWDINSSNFSFNITHKSHQKSCEFKNCSNCTIGKAFCSSYLSKILNRMNFSSAFWIKSVKHPFSWRRVDGACVDLLH